MNLINAYLDLVTFIQLLYYSFIGLPFSVLIASKFIDNKYILPLLIASPIFGVSIGIWLVTLLNFLGFSQARVVLIPFLFSTLCLVLLFKQIIFRVKQLKFSVKYYIFLFLILVFILAFAVHQNLSDIITIGYKNYFPATNSDTFNYLSQIDYLATNSGWEQITYPAGFTSTYPGVIRLAVGAFTAHWKVLTGWDTHIAFFSTIRCMMAVSSVGVFAIALTFGKSLLPAILATSLFSISNFYLHQVLQQFLSSTLGIPVSLCIVLFCIVYPDVSRDLRLFINGIIGFFCGVLIITSVEAAPFIILPTCITILLFLVFRDDSQFIKNIKYTISVILSFLISIFIGMGTIGLQIVQWYAIQAQSGLGNHPGNWIATPGFIYQWSGLVPLFPGKNTSNFNYLLTAPITLFLVVLILILLTRTIFQKNAINFANKNLAILCFGTFGLTSQISFALMGKGYAMLKVTDYFIFQIPLLIGWLVAYLMENDQVRGRINYLFLIGLFVFNHISLSLPEKEKSLNQYVLNIQSRPPLSNFVVDVKNADDIKGVAGDFCGFYADLFAYINRLSKAVIIPDAQRYQALNPINISHVFRLNVPEFGDINYPITQKNTNIKQILPSEGYVMICNDLGTNWLPPEGTNGVFRRWLSKVGEFTVFGSIRKENAKLTIEIEPGPDLSPSDNIQITMQDQLVAVASAKELPRILEIEIPQNLLNQNIMIGKIIVQSQGQGVRQIRIGKIFTK